MPRMPDDLQDYLTKLISPPKEYPGEVPHIEHLGAVDFSKWADNSLNGMIVHGTPTTEQAAECMRVLKPGAHLLLVAPDTQPTGHTGACNIEDAGFEIRDAILWVREPGRLHYVPKASRSEREAGCEKLPGRTGAEATDSEEGQARLNSPRTGAGRSAELIHNFHPTVKSIGIMERLLGDVSADQGPILDPFCGSGSTGVACIRTGHSFIGIEREPDYLAIADARLRHHNGNTPRPPALIESDVPPPPPPEEVSFEDFFGLS